MADGIKYDGSTTTYAYGAVQDRSIKGGNDVLSIGYQELIAPMVKSIQQLKAENEDLKQKLNDIFSRLSALEKL